MSKKKRAQFSHLKAYFKAHFPSVRSVEVDSKKVGHDVYGVSLKVQSKGRWYVVKKQGHEMNEVVGKIKRAMDNKLRKQWDRKKRSVHKHFPIHNFIEV